MSRTITRQWLPHLVAVSLLAFAGSNLHAQLVPAIEFSYEPQEVRIGDTTAIFSGWVRLRADGEDPRVDGMLKLQMEPEESLSLRVIFAKRQQTSIVNQRKPLLIVAEDVESETSGSPASRLFVGTVTAVGAESCCDLWDLVGTDAVGSARIQFLTNATRARVMHEFPRHVFGQISKRVAVLSPPQTVEPFDTGDSLDFAARVDVRSDNRADGQIYVGVSKHERRYKVCFGALFPRNGGGWQLVLVGAFDNATDSNGLLRATVQIEADPTDPECLLWDLTNGETASGSRFTATFDAESSVEWPSN